MGVSGSGFAPGETIDIWFDVTNVGTSTATNEGTFLLMLTVPEEYGPFAPEEVLIRAVGLTSEREADAPFTVTVDDTARLRSRLA